MEERLTAKKTDHPDLVGGIVWADCELDWINAYGKRCYNAGCAKGLEAGKVLFDAFPQAHRLALELECLLLSCTDTAATAKWWDSAHEALEQWREFCREDSTHNAVLRGAEGVPLESTVMQED